MNDSATAKSVCCDGDRMHREALGEDISIAGLLAGEGDLTHLRAAAA